MFSDDILTMLRHHTSLTAVFIMFFHDRFLQYGRITADRTATARYVAFLRVLEFYSEYTYAHLVIQRSISFLTV